MYALFGQTLLNAKQVALAVLMFNKLRSCAHTDHDTVTKMFSYKQLGRAFLQIKKYESAEDSFKFMLALAWTIKSSHGEFEA